MRKHLFVCDHCEAEDKSMEAIDYDSADAQMMGVPMERFNLRPPGWAKLFLDVTRIGPELRPWEETMKFNIAVSGGLPYLQHSITRNRVSRVESLSVKKGTGKGWTLIGVFAGLTPIVGGGTDDLDSHLPLSNFEEGAPVGDVFFATTLAPGMHLSFKLRASDPGLPMPVMTFSGSELGDEPELPQKTGGALLCPKCVKGLSITSGESKNLTTGANAPKPVELRGVDTVGIIGEDMGDMLGGPVGFPRRRPMAVAPGRRRGGFGIVG